jgi:Mannosyltransferase (PIG-V)
MIGSVDTGTGTTTETEAPPGPGSFLYRHLGVTIALGLYTAIKVAQLAFVAWLAVPDGPSIKDRLLAWDGGWFVRVATEGYPHTYSYDASGHMVGNGLAFFPLYPLLIRGVHWCGVDAGIAAIAISWAAGVAATILLYHFGTALKDERVGYALVILFNAAPMSVVLSMGYSEALFSALVIGMLYAAYRNAFLIAGALGLGAALTRPTGLAAAVALAVAAVLAIRAGTAGWRAAIGALVALAGVPGYLLWVGLRVGDLNAWFTIQTAGWGTTFDWGSSSWNFLYTAFHQGNGWVQVSVAIILVAAIIAAGFAVVRRAWPPLIVYGLLALALVVGQAGYYHSKPRLLLPVLLTLIPAAYAAGRARSSWTAAAGLVGYAGFGLWYGAYMITVWPYTI